MSKQRIPNQRPEVMREYMEEHGITVTSEKLVRFINSVTRSIGSEFVPPNEEDTKAAAAFLLELMQAGLGYAEARTVGYEEALCLLHHARFERELHTLDAEEARIASLSFADPQEQQRALIALRHKAKALTERFYG